MPVTVEPQALMYVHMNPPPDRLEEFNAWYDQHAPARVAMPRVLNGRRYWRVGPDGPRHLALYDLADVSALYSPEYLDLRAGEKPRDRDFMGRLPLVDRRVYRALDAGRPWAAEWTEHARFVLSVTMDPPPEQVEDYHAWYLEEHIPMLMKVPGWRRIRRFAQLDAGSSFLALHEIESLDVFGLEAYRAARETLWRHRVLGYVARRERLVFELAGAFSSPA